MRLLHTSDWHLGRSFHREGMLPHQAVWIDHLVETVRSERVDVVLVSGDVYDRALPPVDAVQLADEALARLVATGARVVVTSGNHDSSIRLGANARLIDAAGVHLRTSFAQVGQPVLLEDAHGEVAVHGIGWLDPTAAQEAWQLPHRSHEAALGEALRRVRSDLAARPGTRSVVMAHAFVAGGEPSQSERDISVGGVDRVPTHLFEGFDYAALGHLHGQQVLSDAVRYSGSPLAYSFSERQQAKGSWLVDLGPHGVTATTFVPAPVPRRLTVLTGTLDELLTDDSLSDHREDWLQVTLTDDLRPRAPMERLRERFPHTLVLAFEPATRPVTALPRPSGSLADDRATALEFVTAVRGTPADVEEAGLLGQAYDACCGDADADPVSAPSSDELEPVMTR